MTIDSSDLLFLSSRRILMQSLNVTGGSSIWLFLAFPLIARYYHVGLQHFLCRRIVIRCDVMCVNIQLAMLFYISTRPID
ncbi:hypothetical protein B0T20DRAFT_92729 [Sordaria brevicollis]|uniref:Uncharacterized protein n=1 Tax=Sordaria brevicollis TaxID=83679 RepID=A0AAE0U3B8_SORBR|nr:hypothetical protein B0T20DRAFT_92729 [Sordaria brevicollis]